MGRHMPTSGILAAIRVARRGLSAEADRGMRALPLGWG
jgi:hypothetical protein